MIEQIAVHGYDDNFSYVLHDGEKAAIVDPSGDIEKVFVVIEKKQLQPVAILITHSHFDHVDKLDEALEKYDVPVYMHKDAHARIRTFAEVRTVDEKDTIEIGTMRVQVLHTPGHISDALCFYIPNERILITGDTLFVEGCGRVGNERDAETLYESLGRLAALPGETQVFPGHDYGSTPHSSIAREKEHNRFLLADGLVAFKKERLG